MIATVLCKSCGQRVSIPEGHGRAMGCPACGVYCEEAPPKTEAGPACPECGEPTRCAPGKQPYCPRCDEGKYKAGAPNTRRRRRSAPVAPARPAPAIECSDEDDGKPYALPPDPEPKEPCPDCGKRVPVGAVVCNHCGFNRQTGATFVREHDEVDKYWPSGPRLATRFGAFLAIQGLASAVMLVVALADGNLLGLTIMWLVGATLLAFVLGTYPSIHLTRNTRGRVKLTKTWRLGFIPLGAADIRWREYEGVFMGKSNHTDFGDVFTLVMLAPWGLIPAIVWWLYVVEPDNFDVALSRDHGSPALMLYRGRNDKVAMEIASTIRRVTGLR
jgi:hypothetical protein